MKSRVLYAASSLDVKTTGQGTPAIDVSEIIRVECIIQFTALSGGTTPSVNFFYQEQAPDGTWINLVSVVGSAQTAIGNFIYSVGAGCYWPHCVGSKMRIGWVVVGGPTTATANITITGDPLT